jgi:hypothetical protein
VLLYNNLVLKLRALDNNWWGRFHYVALKDDIVCDPFDDTASHFDVIDLSRVSHDVNLLWSKCSNFTSWCRVLTPNIGNYRYNIFGSTLDNNWWGRFHYVVLKDDIAFYDSLDYTASHFDVIDLSRVSHDINLLWSKCSNFTSWCRVLTRIWKL